MTLLVSKSARKRLRTSHRCLTGRLATDSGEDVTFESALERDWLILLDFDPSVVYIEVQPFSLYYDHEEDGQRRRYTPDILIRYDERRHGPETVVYEVKPRDELRSEWASYRPRFKAALRYCRQQGWGFKVVNERHIRVPRLANARFLRRYRSLPLDALTSDQLLYTLRATGPTTPEDLLVASYWSVESRMQALPALWRLVACRLVACDLDAPLTMSSPISVSEEYP